IWLRAVTRARTLPDSALPLQSVPGEGPPPAHRWAERDPAAAARLTAAKTVIAAIADEHTLPAENLIQPDAIRRVAWSPPEELNQVGQMLTDLGARPWQVGLVSVPLQQAF